MDKPNTISARTYKTILKNYPDVMNIEQMCEVLGISTKTGYRLLKEGQIESLKVGRSYRIPKVKILQYLNIDSSKKINSVPLHPMI